MRRLIWIIVPLALLFALTAAGAAVAGSSVVKAKAKLVGSGDFAKVKGVARFVSLPKGHRRLSVRVKHAKMLRGEVLDVFLADEKIGTLEIKRGGYGKLLLRSKKGDSVPETVAGKLVDVKKADGTSVVSGSFPP